MRTVGILAASVLSFVSLQARADTAKAWAAAKAGLPADAKIIIALDLAALQKTQLFAAVYPKLIEKAEVQKTLESLKTSCKVDPLATVAGVIMAQTADQEDGALYLALSGIDRAKLSSCLAAAMQGMADKTTKISVKQDGNVTQISDGKESQFFGWIGKDVVVVSPHAKDKASLVKWMSGKGALGKTEVGKFIAKLSTSAAVWGAGEASKEIEPGITARGGYGAVTFAKGNADADVHAVMGSASQATAMASAAQKQLDDARGQMPGPLGGMLKAVTITPASDEVVFKGSFAEKDLQAALAMVLAGP